MSYSKRKGSRIEREIEKLHVESGVPATRVPMSGALGSRYPEHGQLQGDIHIFPKVSNEHNTLRNTNK